MPKTDRLTPKQVRAIAAMLQSKDVRDAARIANVSERTLFRWMKDDAFRSAMKEAESQAIAQVMRRLSNLCALALDVLEKEMESDLAKESVRVRAADVVLAKVHTFKELNDFDERLAALESRMSK